MEVIGKTGNADQFLIVKIHERDFRELERLSCWLDPNPTSNTVLREEAFGRLFEFVRGVSDALSSLRGQLVPTNFDVSIYIEGEKRIPLYPPK